MMMRKCLSAIVLLLCAMSAAGQEELKAKMNEIKMDSVYYSCEATASSREMAQEDAISMLMEIIARNNITVTEEHITKNAEFIYIPRGERTRAFVYIKKEKLSGAGTAAMTTPVPTETPAPTEGPKQETSVVTTTETQQPASPTPTANVEQKDMDDESEYSTVLLILSQCEQVTDAARCLRDYKKDGTIMDFGNVTNSGQLQENNYLIIYDDENTIRAILSLPENGERMNVLTGDADAPGNYRGYRVLWFR